MNKFFDTQESTGDDIKHRISHSQMKMWRECRHKKIASFVDT